MHMCYSVRVVQTLKRVHPVRSAFLRISPWPTLQRVVETDYFTLETQPTQPRPVNPANPANPPTQPTLPTCLPLGGGECLERELL